MHTFLWIIYFIGFGGFIFSAYCEFADEAGAIFWAALLAMLWPLIAAIALLMVAASMWWDRKRIRWPWQRRASPEGSEGGAA